MKSGQPYILLLLLPFVAGVSGCASMATPYVCPIGGQSLYPQGSTEQHGGDFRLVQVEKADYPEELALDGVEGLVVLVIKVGPDGAPQKVLLSKGVHPQLDQAAIEAAYGCRFERTRECLMNWVRVGYRFR